MIKQLAKSIVPDKTYKNLAQTRAHVEDGVIRVMNKVIPIRQRVLLKQLDTTMEMDYERASILLAVDSHTEMTVRTHSSSKEPDTVRWVESTMRPGDMLFDVGANVGAYSLIAGKFHGSKVKVIAFEPAFMNYAKLCRNISINGLSDIITAMPVALSDSTELSTFNYYAVESGAARHALGEALDFAGNAFTPALKQSMLAFGLDDFVERFGVTPTHIKIDVDGIEWKILQGGDKTFRNVRHLIVELEINNPEVDDMVAYVRERGLHLVEKVRLADVGSYFGNTFNFFFQRNE